MFTVLYFKKKFNFFREIPALLQNGQILLQIWHLLQIGLDGYYKTGTFHVITKRADFYYKTGTPKFITKRAGFYYKSGTYYKTGWFFIT